MALDIRDLGYILAIPAYGLVSFFGDRTFEWSSVCWKWDLRGNDRTVRGLDWLVEAHGRPVIHSGQVVHNPSNDDAVLASQHN